MTKYHKCKHLETTIKDMCRGALFEMKCLKTKEDVDARNCRKCIYEGRNK